jgi:RimJ/RimL family protein N-acetyltransferase
MIVAVTTEPTADDIGIRPMEPGDAARLVEFHEALSEHTKERRYFTPHPHLTEAEVHHFTNVDHNRREALVAIADDHIVGVGRYEMLHDPLAAEVAFVVGDAWQRRGIGRALFEALTERAIANGIHRFVADTLEGNAPMIGLLRSSGVDVREEHELGRAEFVLTLIEPGSGVLPQRHPHPHDGETAGEGEISERRSPGGTT